MGADLILTATRWPKRSDTGEVAPAGEALVAEMKRRWAAVTREPRETILEDVGVTYEGTPEELEEGWRQLTAEVFGLVEDVFGTDGSRRDVTDLVLDGTVWLVSGGMSWGDDPSEAFRPLRAMAMAGITEEPVEVADEHPGTAVGAR